MTKELTALSNKYSYKNAGLLLSKREREKEDINKTSIRKERWKRKREKKKLKKES